VAQINKPKMAEEKFAEMRQAQLQKALDSLPYEETRDFFWKIFIAGHLPDNQYYFNDRLRPLFASGLVQRDEHTGHISVTPQNIEPAKAIYAAQIAAKSSSNSQT